MARVTRESGILSDLSEKVQDVASQPPHEGEMTRRIEQQTAKIPSMGFLGLAVGSMVASAALALMGRRKDTATFVGLWAPSLLLIGVYNKLVKIENEVIGQGGQSRHRDQDVSSRNQGYGSSQGFSESYSGGQGASAQGIAGQHSGM